MIGRIEGILVEIISSSTICVDIHGLGYEISIPGNIILPKLGETIKLFTHLIMRSEIHTLYGFGSSKERDAFRLIMKVTGIGSKVALSILTNLPLVEFYEAISLKQSDQLLSIPGIGRKNAERLVLELHGKLKLDFEDTNNSKKQSEILKALAALGYSKKESIDSIRKIPEGLDITESIRKALKALN